MERLSTIYALCDPETDAVRYIGKTVVPLNVRLGQHCSHARKGRRTHLHCWIRSLSVRPIIQALEVVPYASDAESEMRIIAEHRARGCDLTNATDGGEGKKGCRHSEESKAKIRAWGIGRKMPPKSAETLRRMAEAQRGKKHSAEHKAKIAAAGIGRRPTPETREKLRTASVGRKFSSEAIAKSVLARRGKPLLPEHRSKIIDAARSKESRAKQRMLKLRKKHTPESIEKMRLVKLGHVVAPETREKMRQSMRAAWARRRAQSA